MRVEFESGKRLKTKTIWPIEVADWLEGVLWFNVLSTLGEVFRHLQLTQLTALPQSGRRSYDHRAGDHEW
jgi:hypothetical protein